MDRLYDLYNRLKWLRVPRNPSLEDLGYNKEGWKSIRGEDEVLFVPRNEENLENAYIEASTDDLEYIADYL